MNNVLTTTKKGEIADLAIHGGAPVRIEPLPPESPGIHFIEAEEVEMVTSVIKAKSPFRYYGPDVQNMCDRLEEKVREKMNRKYAIAVSSGTEALYVSMAALDIGPGDEVLIPGYLWTSCISSVVRLGGIPRLVDIDDTFTMSPQDLKKKISGHSKAVLLVHMSGAPGNVEEILEIARKRNLSVVEDCAQSNGATLNGTPSVLSATSA